MIGGFTGAFTLDSCRINNLVLLQGRATDTGIDGRPAEIIPGAFVLPVTDLCELLSIALLNIFGSSE